MKKFFLNQNNDFIINLFSIEHFLLIFLTILITILIINNKTYLENISKRKFNLLKVIFALVIITNIILKRGSLIYYNVYDFRYNLDLNFCDFTNIMFLIYLFTNNQKIYNICFYMAFVGPLLSILFPVSNLSLANYSFYSFIISHYFIFIINFILMFMNKKIYKKKEFIQAVIFIYSYILCTLIIDYIFDTNYNIPLNYLNIIIEDSKLITILSQTIITTYLTFFLVIFLFLLVGKKFLKYFSNFKKNISN